MTERDMFPTVKRWLEWQGMHVLWESVIFSNADVVGVRFANQVGREVPRLLRVVVVELKIRDIAGVIRQSAHHREHPVESYAAMPDAIVCKMRKATVNRFRREGVGLLAVDPDAEWTSSTVFTAVRPSIDPTTRWITVRARLWRRLRELGLNEFEVKT